MEFHPYDKNMKDFRYNKLLRKICIKFSTNINDHELFHWTKKHISCHTQIHHRPLKNTCTSKQVHPCLTFLKL